jgi:hypothetical protein
MHDTRLVHVKVVQGRFISVLPPSEKLPEFRLPYVSPRAGASNAPSSGKTERTDSGVNATLLICRRMIESAVHDAKEAFRGEPTAQAKIARAWIDQRIGKPDRELYSSNPEYRAAYQEGFYLSFEWCCQWLNHTERETEEIRQQKLSEIDELIMSRWLATRRRIQMSKQARTKLLYARKLQGQLFPIRYHARRSVIPSAQRPQRHAIQ